MSRLHKDSKIDIHDSNMHVVSAYSNYDILEHTATNKK